MAKPTAQQLAHCLEQVTRFIPSPAAPKIKIQASKFGLKVGQLLGSAGEQFTVVATDSRGVTLETTDGRTCRIESKESLCGYTKVRRQKVRKAKKNACEGESLPLL